MKEIVNTINGNEIKAYRIDNDVNGNPRYVVHFICISNDYEEAIKVSRCVGGKKYRAKWFGGGIVFQSYDLKGDLATLLSK